MKIAAVKLLAKDLGVAPACRVVGIPRSTYYPSIQAPGPRPPKQRRGRSLRRLPAAQQAEIRALLNSERFRDLPPRQIYATLLNEGPYVCYWRTMYNILHEYNEVRAGRNQRVHPPYTRPELVATAPNQVWSMDITTLRGPRKGTYYKCYVIVDIFSRYVVGWMVAPYETADLAADLVVTTCERQGVTADPPTVHTDRGAPMTARTYIQLLGQLGVTRSYARPYQSNDNPYSEALFRTAQYPHLYPRRFGSLEDAQQWARWFFAWYNEMFYHSDLGLMHPLTVHYGHTEAVRVARQQVMDAAYAQHPEHFLGGRPRIPMPLRAVWINKPKHTT